MPLIAGTQVGPYEVIAPLGAGGMGEVWRARDTRLQREVAIKVLPASLATDADRVRRFMQEAKAASALNHPNIVTIHEIGEADAGRFIVMELVQGQTLSAISKPWAIDQLINISAQIAKALSATHAAGITHRDIKPDNIMVRDDGYVKILDFGLARLAPTHLALSDAETVDGTRPGTLLGTVRYMSPEQARGETAGSASDIFSLGVVLYELATGQHPFQADSMVGILHGIISQPPLPPSRVNPAIPAAFEALILRMLEKDASARPTAVEVEKAFDTSDLKKAQTLPDDRSPRIVTESESDPVAASQSEAGGHSGSPHRIEASPSIAVLPFVNMSNDAENEYFCDGLAEELLNALAKIEALRVAARTSAFSFKGKDTDVREIGQKLNVSTVLEGSVRKAGHRLRITAQLINVSDGYHLWSERYDREMKDIFDIQDEISLSIVATLKVKLLGAEKAAVLKRYTANNEAYELYLKGRYFWFKVNPEAWKKSRECFEQALEKDPNFAIAYTGLADALAASAVFTPSREVFPKAKEMAAQALKLDPSMAEAWCSRAAVKFFYEWDGAGAESDCKHAIELNPRYVLVHDLYSLCLLTQGRFDEAIGEARRACELDPLSGYINASLGVTLYFSRRYDEAIAQLLKGAELDPGQIWSQMWLVDLYEQRGLYQEALHHRQKLLILAGQTSLAVEIGQEFQRLGYPGVLRKCLDGLQQESKFRYVSPLDFAAIYARLGEPEKALDWLEKAYAERAFYLNFLKVRPAWESLHSNPRYADLLRRVGLSE